MGRGRDSNSDEAETRGGGPSIARRPTYGLMGSLNVSSRSSILDVCCRMASSGLGSAASFCAPPKAFWPPMRKPPVPKAAAPSDSKAR